MATCKATIGPTGDGKTLVCDKPKDHDGPTHAHGDEEWGDPELSLPASME